MEHKSNELNELFTALAKAQAEMGTAGLTNNNPFFKSKYADLAEIIKVSRPALTKHGLAVMQCVNMNDKGQAVLLTVLGHSSGQCISSEMVLTPAKQDMQSLGSAITYSRRYAYAALVGVVVSEEDDDGNHAAAVSQSESMLASNEQQRMIIEAAGEETELITEICNKLRIKGLYQLPASRVEGVLQYIDSKKK